MIGPTEKDQTAARREVRKLVRRAERQPRGTARDRKTTRLIYATAWLVYVERVLALDPLERARLKPADLLGMQRAVTVADVQARIALMAPSAGLELVTR